MPTVSEVHIDCLRGAFARLLGAPVEGAMAYILGLSPDIIAELCGLQPMQIPGWEVYAVGAGKKQGTQFITADRAVDLREEKQGSVLLLIDWTGAGAGMDGIYSAVREIGEKELFAIAAEIALKKLPPDVQEFARNAYRRARRIGRLNAISPWREFDFYALCAAKPELVGEHVALLGLWPVQTSEGLRKEDLDVSAQLVERLLLPTGASNTIRARIDSLLLPDDAGGQVKELEKFLRETEGTRLDRCSCQSARVAKPLAECLEAWFR